MEIMEIKKDELVQQLMASGIYSTITDDGIIANGILYTNKVANQLFFKLIRSASKKNPLPKERDLYVGYDGDKEVILYDVEIFEDFRFWQRYTGNVTDEIRALARKQTKKSITIKKTKNGDVAEVQMNHANNTFLLRDMDLFKQMCLENGTSQCVIIKEPQMITVIANDWLYSDTPALHGLTTYWYRLGAERLSEIDFKKTNARKKATPVKRVANQD